MKKHKIIAILISLALILVVGVGATLAVLTSRPDPVTATFVIGDVDITLEESVNNGYQLIPGKAHTKDPKVTVKSESEDCWVFVKITESFGFDEYLTYALADGWTHLGGYDGIYYREVNKAPIDLDFYILKDNIVTVKDNLTAEKMSNITSAPTLTFRAYAIQRHSIENALEAWFLVLEEGEG